MLAPKKPLKNKTSTSTNEDVDFYQKDTTKSKKRDSNSSFLSSNSEDDEDSEVNLNKKTAQENKVKKKEVLTELAHHKRLELSPKSYPFYDGETTGAILEGIQCFQIYQHSDKKADLSACETSQIFSAKSRKYGNISLFKCKEDTSICRRSIKGRNRTFEKTIYNSHTGCPALVFEKSCSLTIFCIWRPEIRVFATHGFKKYFIGSIADSFDCTTSVFNIQDHEGRLQYSLRASSCQKGLAFSCLRSATFQLLDSQGALIDKAVSYEQNKYTNQKGYFEIKLGEQMPWNHRALLLAAGFYLESRFFVASK